MHSRRLPSDDKYRRHDYSSRFHPVTPALFLHVLSLKLARHDLAEMKRGYPSTLNNWMLSVDRVRNRLGREIDEATPSALARLREAVGEEFARDQDFPPTKQLLQQVRAWETKKTRPRLN